jgi:cyclohexyl-isocyanide hydratase
MWKIGILLFPGVEELDFVGPFEVLSYVNKIIPNSVQVSLVAESTGELRAFNGLRILPDMTIDACPALDVLVVPGGKGRLTAMKNANLRQFIRRQATQARFIASVCTGAFLLAEAGLLTGCKATTYHECLDELARYEGVEVVATKVVPAGRIVTAGGVSSGLELGFYLLRELFDADTARLVARKIEYSAELAFG